MRPLIHVVAAAVASVAVVGCSSSSSSSSTAGRADSAPSSARFGKLANIEFKQNRATDATAATLKDELLFQRATQAYLWAMPLVNTMGMYDGFREKYGVDYNVMAIWEKRLDAKTHITTPNSDLIYGIAFANLAETGPLVFEAPPKLQGILLDMWQRPIPCDTKPFQGDVGLPGPDGGAGGKFLLLPPGYKGDVPEGHYVYRSGTNNVFIFLRSFYQSLDNIQPAVDVLKQCKIYPLGKQETAKAMVFNYASGKRHDMLPRTDVRAFEELKWLVDAEGDNLAEADSMGMLAGLGIVKGEPFNPDAKTKAILSDAAATAYKMSRVIGTETKFGDSDFHIFKDRQWVNPVNNSTSMFKNAPWDLGFTSTKQNYRNLDARAWFFTDYYSISPGMVSMTPGKGAFYMVAFKDAGGQWLDGQNSYTVRLPKDIPAALFWSVTLYEAENASGLDNGQPFPSLGKLNHPDQESDGSTILHIGPKAPVGKEKNWLATPPGRGYFAILRLYGPTEPALDFSWKPGDLEKVK